MKVLLVDQFGEFGGGQRAMLSAARGIRAQGGEVWAAMPEGAAFRELTTVAKEMAPIPCGPFTAHHKGAADVARYAAQLPRQVSAISRLAREVDLIYVHGPRVAPAAALATSGKPLVYHAHSIVEQRGAAALLARSLRRFDGLIAVSAFVARWFEAKTPGKMARVIYNGVSGFPFRERNEFLRIGVLGRITPEKGQLHFVRAAAEAAAANPQLRFVVAGRPMFGSDRYADEVRAAAGNDVEFVPWQDNPQSSFEQIDMLAVPSAATEACPLVVLEAFSCGVPVIAAHAGGIPELIEHGKTGVLMPSIEPDVIARTMVEAAGNPALMRTISKQARASWQARFTEHRFQSEVCEVLDGVLRALRPASNATRARA